MSDRFSIPQEFEQQSQELFQKDEISEREFVDFCLLTTRLVDDYWEHRQGLAYHVVGAWLAYDNIDEDDLLQQIGIEFGDLELPDKHIAKSEEGVREKWQKAKGLVEKADKKFPEEQ